MIVHVRRRQGALGYTVAATRINDKDPVWQTEVAVPIRNLALHGTTIEAVTSRGRLFEIDEQNIQVGVITQAKASAMRDERVTLSLSQAVEVDAGIWALAPRSGYNQVVFHRTTGDQAGLKLLTLTVPLGDAAIEPIPFDSGLLVPLRDGRIVLADRVTGAERMHPFHPSIDAGSETRWYPAAVIDGGREFVIANDKNSIYRVGIKEKPQPQLQELSSLAVTDRIVGPLAAIGQVFFGTTRSAAGDTLICFALPETKEVQKWPLTGRVRWGPRRVADTVLLATDTELICIDSQQQQKWTVPWEHGPIAGQPVVIDQQLMLATEDGRVLALDVSQGTTINATGVGEPLNGGPFVLEDKMLVAGESGVLFVVARPSP